MRLLPPSSVLSAGEDTKIGIVNPGGGVGDHIHFTSLPENYYKNTQRKS